MPVTIPEPSPPADVGSEKEEPPWSFFAISAPPLDGSGSQSALCANQSSSARRAPCSSLQCFKTFKCESELVNVAGQ